MKRVIATILLPITGILLFAEAIKDIGLTMLEPVIEGIKIIVEKNYDFWKEMFKWKN